MNFFDLGYGSSLIGGLFGHAFGAVQVVLYFIVIIIVVMIGETIIRKSLKKIANNLTAYPNAASFFSTLTYFTKTWSRLLILYLFLSYVNAFSQAVYYLKLAVLLLLLLSVAKFTVQYINSIFAGMLAKDDKQSEKSLGIVSMLIKFAVYVLFLLIFLDQTGIKLTPIIAVLGISGFAIAFAVQDTLSNLISGVQISFVKSFKPGNYLSQGGINGIVKEVNWRHTVLKADDGSTTFIPNKIFANTVVKHISNQGAVQPCIIPFSCAYSEDADRVISLAQGVADKVFAATDGVDKQKKPVIKLLTVSSSGLQMQIKFFLEDSSVKGALTETTLKTLHQEFKANDVKV